MCWKKMLLIDMLKQKFLIRNKKAKIRQYFPINNGW